MIARQTAVQTAIQMKGQRNTVVDLYNTYLPHPRRYKVKYSDMLCATYVSSIFIKLGWTDIVPPECGAHQLYQNMAALGCGVQDKKRVPEIGDLIFFGNSKYVSGIQHVGIVTEVTNDKKRIYYYDIQSVVGRHTCPVGYSYIWGYGMPDYQSKDLGPIPVPTPTPEPVPQPTHTFVVGDLVTINPGAKWYKGQTIKQSCFMDKWYISSIKGDRAVLGMNYAETNNIQSPIHTCDITLVNSTVPEIDDKIETLTIKIKSSSKKYLDSKINNTYKNYGEVIDAIISGAIK